MLQEIRRTGGSRGVRGVRGLRESVVNTAQPTWQPILILRDVLSAEKLRLCIYLTLNLETSLKYSTLYKLLPPKSLFY